MYQKKYIAFRRFPQSFGHLCCIINRHMSYALEAGANRDICRDVNYMNNEQNIYDICRFSKKCGGCTLTGVPYDQQLKDKRKAVAELLSGQCGVDQVVGMEDPTHYRNKVNAAFDIDERGRHVSGIYKAGTHEVVPISGCLIENEIAQEIISTIRRMLRSFRIKTYDEDTGYGLLRHVHIRVANATGQVMVVLVLSSPILPSKNNFVKALVEKHPCISTVIINVNDRHTSMVLGERNITIYGKGFITDILGGKKFRISPNSFYQVNSVMTEKLYKRAITVARLTGRESVIDAYCGIGTIGLIASSSCAQVTGIELNPDAVRDAKVNAKINGVKNVNFFCADAGEVMEKMAAAGVKVDVVFMDPPRGGSTERFIDSVATLAPSKVVYISCNPRTLARDLKYFKNVGYRAKNATPFDMFPFTEECEVLTVLTNGRGAQ